MGRPDYWRLKAAVLEAQLVEQRAIAQAQAARQQQVKLLTDAGIDPAQNCEFVDADEDVRAAAGHG